MTHHSFRTSAPDAWTSPRPTQDPSMRLRTHGPIQPMDRPGFFAQLLRRR